MRSQDNFIEQLSEVASVRSFFALSACHFSAQIDQLIQRVFRKTDFALKSVVDSLFEHQGPLAELSVRLKLLLGLGVISAEIYQDIHAFFEIKIKMSDEIDEPSFNSDMMILFAQQLHHIDPHPLRELHKLRPQIDNQNSIQHQMQQKRLERLIRSSLIVAISNISSALDIESPL